MPTGTKLEKAYLRLHEPTPTGPGGELGTVRFEFNPKEYTVKKSASWECKPAKGAKKSAMPEFKGAEQRSMSIEIFLDANEDGSRDITKDIEKLFKTCTPLDSTVGKKKPSPPFVVFGWGKKMSVTCYVKSVSVKYTLFKPDGTPVRAVCTVELQEVPSAAAKQNPTSGGLAARSTHTVVAGDTLQSIAYAEYGDPSMWRALALANRIDDPLRVPVGVHLLVPPPEEATVLS